jgi:CHASE2 domain-containing sensor protein
MGASVMAGHHLSHSDLWVDLRARIFQATTALGRPPLYPQRTIAVLLDDDDYWSDAPLAGGAPGVRDALAGRVPTNRAYLARLITKLDAANVSVIALDFDLRSPRPGTDDFSEYKPETDELIAAIRQACAHKKQIVLASSLTEASGEYAEVPSVYDSANLDSACVHKGYIQLPYDMRRLPGAVTLANGQQLDSFSLAATRAVDPVAYSRVIDDQETVFPYSRFITDAAFRDPSQEQSIFTGREILAADADKLAAKLVTRIVVIGADWHSLAWNQGPYVDRHNSPGGLLAGTLLHANYIEAMVQDGMLRPFPDNVAEILDVVLVLLLSCLGLLEIHVLWKWAGVAAVFLVVLVGSYLFLQTFGLFLDVFFPLIILGLHAVYEHLSEWRRAAHELAAKEVAS